MMLADQNASDDAEAVNYPLSCEISCLGWVSFPTRALLMHLLHAVQHIHVILLAHKLWFLMCTSSPAIGMRTTCLE